MTRWPRDSFCLLLLLSLLSFVAAHCFCLFPLFCRTVSPLEAVPPLMVVTSRSRSVAGMVGGRTSGATDLNAEWRVRPEAALEGGGAGAGEAAVLEDGGEGIGTHALQASKQEAGWQAAHKGLI